MEDRYTLTDLPEVGEWYYAVEWFTYTYPALIAAGMAFKTHEAAERNKYAVYKALTGKEWGKE